MAEGPAKAPADRARREEELREALVRGEQLRQQLSILEEQRALLAGIVQDAARSLATLEGIDPAQPEPEVLVPVGAGTFLSARLTQVDRVITGIGAGLHAELPLADARKRLEARLEQLEATTKRLDVDIQRLVDEMGRLSALVEAVQGA